MLNTVLLALALIAGADSIPATPPPPAHLYCTPWAFRDYEVLVGRAAVLRPAPGCKVGALVRRASLFSDRTDEPLFIPLPSPGEPLPTVWLFGSRLQYSLDGVEWHPLELR